MSGGYSDPEVTEPAGETGGIRVTASTSMTEGECARLSTSIGSNCVTKLPRAPSPDSDGSVSLRLMFAVRDDFNRYVPLYTKRTDTCSLGNIPFGYAPSRENDTQSFSNTLRTLRYLPEGALIRLHFLSENHLKLKRYLSVLKDELCLKAFSVL